MFSWEIVLLDLDSSGNLFSVCNLGNIIFINGFLCTAEKFSIGVLTISEKAYVETCLNCRSTNDSKVFRTPSKIDQELRLSLVEMTWIGGDGSIYPGHSPLR